MGHYSDHYEREVDKERELQQKYHEQQQKKK